MRKTIYTLMAIVISSCAVAQTAIKATDFKWLEGSWVMDAGEVTIYESWQKENNNSYTGKGYVIQGKDTIVKETMKIENVGGFWVFIAQINAQNPVLFTLKPTSTGQEFTFENLEHDNPQRVIYKFVTANQLYAKTEAEVNGEKLEEEYNYSRR